MSTARDVAEFLLGPLSVRTGASSAPGGQGRTSVPGLPRRLRERRARADGAPRGHGRAALAPGSASARALAIDRFADDEHGGFFLAERDGDGLVARTKPLDDNPLPSGNSMLAWVLLGSRGSGATMSSSGAAAGVLRLVAPALSRVPGAFSWALAALDLYLGPPRELAVVGRRRRTVARAALTPFQPRTVVAVGPADTVPLLEGKHRVDGAPAVYVCERFACRAPVRTTAELVA